MVKTRASRKRKIFTSKRPKLGRKKSEFAAVMRDDVGITQFNPVEKLTDIKLIGTAIMECMIENDPEGVMEVIESHLEALNKSKFLKEAGVPRSTMYKLLKMKNPTIRTLAKIMYAAHHSEESFKQS